MKHKEDRGRFYRKFGYFWFALSPFWVAIGLYTWAYPSEDHSDYTYILNFVIAGASVAAGIISLYISKKRNDATGEASRGESVNNNSFYSPVSDTNDETDDIDSTDGNENTENTENGDDK